MSSKLSAVAQLQIVRLLGEANGYLWYTGVCGKLPSDWKVLAHLYLCNLAAPPESYLRSRELAMIQKDAVSEEDLSFIFSHGQPLVFEACPERLIPKLIEMFEQLNEEPPFLHVTIMRGNVGSIEVSPPLYVDCFPCTACRRDAAVQPSFRHKMANACDANSKCVVETFHIRSNRFTKQLSIELYYRTYYFYGYEFYARPETASDNAKFFSPIKVIVHVEDPVCGVAASPSP
ncbi:hypothetical protein AAVH_29964 [Aphelenchoides avenae]|nr:hypothetical protein AAVH_29964 [Aphelenchus avenae]